MPYTEKQKKMFKAAAGGKSPHMTAEEGRRMMKTAKKHGGKRKPKK